MSFAVTTITWVSMSIQAPGEEPSAAVAKGDVAEKVVSAVPAGELRPIELVLSFPSEGKSIAAVATRSHIGRRQLDSMWRWSAACGVRIASLNETVVVCCLYLSNRRHYAYRAKFLWAAQVGQPNRAFGICHNR